MKQNKTDASLNLLEVGGGGGGGGGGGRENYENPY